MSSVPVRVAVDGATGYVGNHVVAELRRQNLDVLALVHAGAREQDVAFLKSLGAGIAVVSLDTDNEVLHGALGRCTHAIHLIGSIAPKKGETLSDLHNRQTENLVKAAQKAGIRKLLHVTALGSAQNALSEYHKTKWQAEQHVRKSGVPFIIYQPSLIIGKECGNRNSKLVARYMELIDTRPRVPVIGGGENKVQPIFVMDLAKAIVQGLFHDEWNNQAYELGGPEIISMREFVQRLLKLKNSNKSIAPIPAFAAGLAAGFCEAFQNVPLVSRDQVKLSSQDNTCKENTLRTTFGITPTSIDDALKSYKLGSASEMAASGK